MTFPSPMTLVGEFTTPPFAIAKVLHHLLPKPKKEPIEDITLMIGEITLSYNNINPSINIPITEPIKLNTPPNSSPIKLNTVLFLFLIVCTFHPS